MGYRQWMIGGRYPNAIRDNEKTKKGGEKVRKFKVNFKIATICGMKWGMGDWLLVMGD